MKTLIMAIHIGRDARDILRTDVLKVLRANDLRIDILSTAADEDYFNEEVGMIELNEGKLVTNSIESGCIYVDVPI